MKDKERDGKTPLKCILYTDRLSGWVLNETDLGSSSNESFCVNSVEPLGPVKISTILKHLANFSNWLLLTNVSTKWKRLSS